MLFLADENIPRLAVEALRDLGHDVAWASETMAGQTDVMLMERAVREHRVILTLDKDFGELAFRRGITGASGIVLFRIPMPGPGRTASTIVDVISSRYDWVGHFSVVTETSIRMRRS